MSVPSLGQGEGGILHTLVHLDIVCEHLLDLRYETDAYSQAETNYHT